MSKKHNGFADRQPFHGERVLTCEHTKLAVGVYTNGDDGVPQVATIWHAGNLHWFNNTGSPTVCRRPNSPDPEEIYTYRWYAVCDECFENRTITGHLKLTADFVHLGLKPFIEKPDANHRRS